MNVCAGHITRDNNGNAKSISITQGHCHSTNQMHATPQTNLIGRNPKSSPKIAKSPIDIHRQRKSKHKNATLSHETISFIFIVFNTKLSLKKQNLFLPLSQLLRVRRFVNGAVRGRHILPRLQLGDRFAKVFQNRHSIWKAGDNR